MNFGMLGGQWKSCPAGSWTRGCAYWWFNELVNLEFFFELTCDESSVFLFSVLSLFSLIPSLYSALLVSTLVITRCTNIV